MKNKPDGNPPWVKPIEELAEEIEDHNIQNKYRELGSKHLLALAIEVGKKDEKKQTIFSCITGKDDVIIDALISFLEDEEAVGRKFMAIAMKKLLPKFI